jgi:hypothetical protein
MEKMVGTVVVDDDDGKAVELIMERLPGKKIIIVCRWMK